jgi:hypothetical protein
MPPQAGPPKDQLNQIADKIKSANSVLVTVSSNPSVDQLSACIGLTLALNKMGKHGTAVYSGDTPSTIEFLKPEKTLEQDTNSLRDFIISLDKSKADKLRYKVEDDVVKIYITPYKTSISEKDFDFSQGDFNVDVVLALGVDKKSDLDKAITSHGRILHDAAVISLNTKPASGHNSISSIEWVAEETSSLCEMAADLVDALDGSALDNQIATALLTGVVVETNRFSNEKSRPHTMKVAGKLMESGASTQLITTKLEQPAKPGAQPTGKASGDGVLEIQHADVGKGDGPDEIPPLAPADKQPKPPTQPEEDDKPQEEDNESSKISDVRRSNDDSGVGNGPRYVSEPPSTGGRLTANDMPEYESYDPTTDPLSQTDGASIIDRPKPVGKQSSGSDDDMGDKTLHDIEESVESPHLHQPDPGRGDKTDQSNGQDLPDQSEGTSPPPLDNARNAVENAVDSSKGLDNPPDPMKALNDRGMQFEENNPKDNQNSDDNDKPSSPPPPPVPPPMTPPANAT